MIRFGDTIRYLHILAYQKISLTSLVSKGMYCDAVNAIIIHGYNLDVVMVAMNAVPNAHSYSFLPMARCLQRKALKCGKKRKFSAIPLCEGG